MSDIPTTEHAGGPEPTPERGRRWLPWAVGGVAVALVVGGGAVVAAQWYFGDGPQPAEVLPASTLAYASVNLDPSGEQQLAARELLANFPAWEEADVDSGDDIRKWLVEDVFDNLECDDLDYDDDLEPWLGDRVATALVPVGDGEPEPVVVVQTDDEDAAEDGLEQLRACSGRDDVHWDFTDGWVVVGPSADVVGEVVDETGDDTLADDDSYRELVDAAGGAGLVTGYVAPGIVDAFATEIAAEEDLPPGLLHMIGESFEGLAASIRVEDDALEVNAVGSFADAFFGVDPVEDGRADLLGEAPAGASLAYVLSMSEGWATEMDAVLREFGDEDGQAMREVLRDLEKRLGQKPTAFAEQLLGDAVMIVIGEDPSEAALRIEGGGARAEEAWGRLPALIDDPMAAAVLQVSRKGDVVVVGPTPAFRAEVLDPEETLAESGDLDDLLPELDDASGAFYVDFDAALLEVLLQAAPAEVLDNIEPLDRAGMNGWYDDGLFRSRVRITID